MPINNIQQPELIQIQEGLHLRKYDGHYELFLSGYQDPCVYQNSEGIFDDSKIPNLDYVKGMCTYLAKVGELYYIEVKEGTAFVPVGDVTIKNENPPIAIWKAQYRGKGIGKLVMQTAIRRLKELEFTAIKDSTVYQWNVPSQRMHESLGFTRTKEDEKEIYYDLIF